MIELRTAVALGKPLIALMEPELGHGGLTSEQVREHLSLADANFTKWGFDDGPRSAELYAALFAPDVEPIEWNRCGGTRPCPLARARCDSCVLSLPSWQHFPASAPLALIPGPAASPLDAMAVDDDAGHPSGLSAPYAALSAQPLLMRRLPVRRPLLGRLLR